MRIGGIGYMLLNDRGTGATSSLYHGYWMRGGGTLTYLHVDSGEGGILTYLHVNSGEGGTRVYLHVTIMSIHSVISCRLAEFRHW